MKVIELRKYSNLPTSQYVTFKNGSELKLYGLVDSNVLASGSKQKIMQALRKKFKKPTEYRRSIKIDVSCSVWSSVSESWHDVEHSCTSMAGYFKNYAEVKQALETIRTKNSHEGIRNLKINCKFSSRYI